MSFALYVCMLQKLHVDNHDYCLIFQWITIFSMLYILLSCKEMFLSHLYPFSSQKSKPRRPCNLSLGSGYNLHLMIIIFSGILSVLEESA